MFFLPFEIKIMSSVEESYQHRRSSFFLRNIEDHLEEATFLYLDPFSRFLSISIYLGPFLYLWKFNYYCKTRVFTL